MGTDGPMRVLVTGPSGMVGRPFLANLMKRFNASNVELFAVSRTEPQVDISAFQGKFRHVTLDLNTVKSESAQKLQNLEDAADLRDPSLMGLLEGAAQEISALQVTGDVIAGGDFSALVHACDFVVNIAADRAGGDNPRGQEYRGKRGTGNNLILNVALPYCLAKLTHAAPGGPKGLIHISTDYVFSGLDCETGKAGVANLPANGYIAKDFPAEVNSEHCWVETTNNYPGQKAISEVHVRRENPRAMIVRIPLMVGPMLNSTEDGTSALGQSSWFRHTKFERKFGFENTEIRYRTHTVDLAHNLSELVGVWFESSPEKQAQLGGTYQYGAQGGDTYAALMPVFLTRMRLKFSSQFPEEGTPEWQWLLDRSITFSKPEGVRRESLKMDIGKLREVLGDKFLMPQTVDGEMLDTLYVYRNAEEKAKGPEKGAGWYDGLIPSFFNDVLPREKAEAEANKQG